MLDRAAMRTRGIQPASLKATYKVYPFSFGRKYQNKQLPTQRPQNLDSLLLWSYEYGKDEEDNDISSSN